MIVVRQKGKDVPLPRRLWRHRTAIMLTAAAIAYTVMVFSVGAASYKTGFFTVFVRPLVDAGIRTPINLAKGMTVTPPRLDIDINYENYRRLELMRRQALEQEALFADRDDYVPASINFQGVKYKVDIRLKGDATDHLLGDKWSFRVEVDGDDSILGMQRFSLHHPRARNYLWEWVYHRALKREGIIALRYSFVTVGLNGSDLGVYALEEHFEKRLIENNSRREGPILRFNEDLMWRELADRKWQFHGAATPGAGTFEASQVDGFGVAKTMQDPAAKELFVKAAHLLDAFRSGEVTTSEAFDTKKLATYFAMVDLLGAEHGARWHNIRFYYNPVTARIEPIGYDASCGTYIRTLSCQSSIMLDPRDPTSERHRGLNQRLFSDRAFFELYLAELDRVSQPQYLDELLAALGDELTEAQYMLFREFPHAVFDTKIIRSNQRYIRMMLTPQRGIHANLRSADEATRTVKVHVAATQVMPVEVLGVYAPDQPERLIPLAAPIVLDGNERETLVEFTEMTLTMPPWVKWTDQLPSGLAVAYRVLGQSQALAMPVRPFAYAALVSQRHDLVRRTANASSFDFIEADDANKAIRIKPGKWTIDRNLIMPDGYAVVAEPGTTLDLVKGAKLICHGPLTWLGTAESPIVVTSSDRKGQGLIVLQARDRSTLRHVHFSHLTNPDEGGWVLTGAVTFFESPVDFTECRFTDNHCEDGLNLIRCDFRIAHCLIARTFADAFDADFCTGSFIDTRFETCGNDGIDVSGSVITIERVTVDGAGDKGISSGEASNVTVNEVTIRKANIGLASKDKSVLQARDVRLIGCKWFVAAFKKKPEFGPATLIVTNLTTHEMDRRHLLEGGSRAVIDGQALPLSAEQDIRELLYGDPPARYVGDTPADTQPGDETRPRDQPDTQPQGGGEATGQP